MQTYEIIVSGRAVHANSADTTLVRTSIGIDKIHVLFDNEEWTAFPVRVTFANGDTIISTSLTLAEIDAPEWAAEAECNIPWEVIQDLGGIRITFQGTDASGNHIITEASGEPLSVVEAGDVGSGTVPSPAPSVDEWNQAYANAMAAANSASGAAESANEAADRANTAAADAEQVLEDGIPLMDADTRGGAKLGDGLEVDENEALNLSTMSATQHGGAKLGSGLTVDDGALSLGDLTQSGSGAEVATDGCAIFSVDGEGWSEQRTTTGKNLLVPRVYSGTINGIAVSAFADGSISLKGTATADSDFVIDVGGWGSTVVPAGDYTFSASGLVSGLKFIVSGNGYNGFPYKELTNTSPSATGAVTDGTKPFNYIQTRVLSGSTVDTVLRPQLELGSTATSYEPYTGGAPSPSPDYPQEIEVARGRNLLDKKFEQGNQADTTATSRIRSKYLIKAKAGESFSFSSSDFANYKYNICTSAESAYPFSNATYGGTDGSWHTSNYSFTVTKDCYISVICMNASNTNINPSDISDVNLQLELGTTPTPYVPYGHVGLEVTHDGTTTVTPIPLPSKGFAASLPDGTADALTVDSAGRWEWSVNTGETIITALTYNGTNAKSNTRAVSAYVNDAILNSGAIKATHGTAKASAYTYGEVGDCSLASRRFVLTLNPTTITSQSDVDAWIASNPVTLLYPLATPTTEHGYIDLPALPSGATVSCPELDEIGVAWFVDVCEPIVEHAANMARRETEENESIEDALAELAARVAALES